MNGTLLKFLVAVAIFCPYFSPASDATNAPTESAEFILEVIPIKYAKASDVAALLGDTNKFDQWMSPPFFRRLYRKFGAGSIERDAQELGQRIITVDGRSNSLSVCAMKQDLMRIKQIVAKVDYPVPQILVEAVVIEFSVHDSNSKHEEVPPHPGLTALTDLGLVVNTTFPFKPTNEFARSINETAYMASLRGDLDAIVTILATNPAVTILQRPRIQTSEEVPAEMFIGESRPYPGGSYYGSYYGSGPYGGTGACQSVNVGYVLETSFWLQTNGLIQLRINKTTERANGNVNIANVGTVPITLPDVSLAQLVVHDREIFAIGGFLETNRVSAFSEIARLDDIPGGGYLNKLITYPKRTVRSEIVVVMRATLLPVPEMAEPMPRTRPPGPGNLRMR
jgi:Type II secretory pathway, component PulD